MFLLFLTSIILVKMLDDSGSLTLLTAKGGGSRTGRRRQFDPPHCQGRAQQDKSRPWRARRPRGGGDRPRGGDKEGRNARAGQAPVLASSPGSTTPKERQSRTGTGLSLFTGKHPCPLSGAEKTQHAHSPPFFLACTDGGLLIVILPVAAAAKDVAVAAVTAAAAAL